MYKEIQENYLEYLKEQASLIETFIIEHNPINDTNINNIYKSFNTILSEISDKIKLYISKFQYKLFNIKIFHIDIDENNHIFQCKRIIGKEIDATSILHDILYFGLLDKKYWDKENNENNEVYVYNVVYNYYIREYKYKFHSLREEKLPQILAEIKPVKIVEPITYIKVKQAFRDNMTLIDKITCKVMTIDIFQYIIYILYTTSVITEYEKLMISSKYAFVVDKLNLHQIYTVKDFLEKYLYIEKQLEHLDIATDKNIKYVIAIKIIDNLFDIALNS
jgi:hypothetical protein